MQELPYWKAWHDKSEAVVHMTKDRSPGIGFPEPAPEIGDSRSRLIGILRDGKIRASYIRHMKYVTPTPIAAAFSEAMPQTIIQMVEFGNYAPWGIFVHKFHVFRQNGGPVFYVNNEYFKALTNDPTVSGIDYPSQLKYLLAPYAPCWQDKVLFHNGKPCDWTHEREWRTPTDFRLPYINGRPDFMIVVPAVEDIDYILSLDLGLLRPTDFICIKDLKKIPQGAWHPPMPIYKIAS